jgi:hypothetical protein
MRPVELILQTLLAALRIAVMDDFRSFQFTILATALLCSGLSFWTWLFLITDREFIKIVLLYRKSILLFQAIIGFAIVLGIVISCFLVASDALFKQDMEIDFQSSCSY